MKKPYKFVVIVRNNPASFFETYKEAQDAAKEAALQPGLPLVSVYERATSFKCSANPADQVYDYEFDQEEVPEKLTPQQESEALALGAFIDGVKS